VVLAGQGFGLELEDVLGSRGACGQQPVLGRDPEQPSCFSASSWIQPALTT